MSADIGKAYNGLNTWQRNLTAVASLTHVQVVMDHTLLTQLQNAKISKVKDLTVIL